MINSAPDPSQPPIEAEMGLTSHANKYDSRLSSNFYCDSLGFGPVSAIYSTWIVRQRPAQGSTSRSVALISSCCSSLVANNGRLGSAPNLPKLASFDGVCWARGQI